MKMYAKDGQAVQVMKKIEGGYLGKIVYEEYQEWDEDEEQADETTECVGDQILFFSELFEHPLTEAYAAEVKALKAEAEKTRREIADLRAMKSNEESLLHKIAQYPFIQKLVDYVTGDYQFVVSLPSLLVEKRERVFRTPYVKAVNLERGGWGLYRVANSSYVSNDDRPFLCFKTMDDVNEYCKDHILSHIRNYNSGQYNIVSNFKEWFNKISDTCEMKTLPEVREAYDDRIAGLMAIEEGQQKESLEKQIQELEEKKQKLLHKSNAVPA